MFTLKQKIALLKQAGVDVADTATEEEVNKLVEENVEVTEEETDEENEKSIGNTSMKSLKSIVSKVIGEKTSAIEQNIMAKLNVKSPEEKKEMEVKEMADFIKDVSFGKKAIDGQSGSFGNAVPTKLADMILEKLDKEAIIRKYAFVFKMAGKFQLPKEGTAVTSYWVGQNASITESNPTLDKDNLDDYYLATRVIIPRGLLNSSPLNIVNYVTNLCVRSITNTEETAFVAGDGSGKPKGIRATTLSAGNIKAQAGAGLAYKDVTNLTLALKPQYRKNAVYLTSTAGILALMNVLDDNKRPIFDLSSMTLLGKPLLESLDIPSNLGTGTNETEIFFGDLQYYYIKDGEDMFMEQDKIIANLQVEVVVAKAVDGVFTMPEALAKLTGVISA